MEEVTMKFEYPAVLVSSLAFFSTSALAQSLAPAPQPLNFERLASQPSKDLLRLARLEEAPQSPPASEAFTVSPCGIKHFCFYDNEGSLHHWAQEHTITTDRLTRKEKIRKIYTTGGYAEIVALQKE